MKVHKLLLIAACVCCTANLSMLNAQDEQVCEENRCDGVCTGEPKETKCNCGKPRPRAEGEDAQEAVEDNAETKCNCGKPRPRAEGEESAENKCNCGKPRAEESSDKDSSRKCSSCGKCSSCSSCSSCNSCSSCSSCCK